MKLSDFVFHYLAEATQAKHVFMLPGGGCMHLVDSLGKNAQFQYICNLHEQACAIAAEAYGQYNNQLGIALVTTGPGGTNTLTGVAGAWIDSTPLLILSGQAKREDMLTGRGVRQMGIQEVDIISMVSPITKYAVTVMEPEKIKYHLQKAIYEATHGRKGPVWLDLPLDVQGAEIAENDLTEFIPAAEIPSDAASEGARHILETIASSKRPVILAGNGIRSAGALNKFAELTSILRIPVLTTWKTSDIMADDHPLYCGRPGIIAQRGANFTQQNADCLLILGSRLDLCQTGFNHPNFAPNAKKLIVDIDANEIKKLDMDFELELVEDAGRVISCLLQYASEYVKDFSQWLALSKGWLNDYPVILDEYKKESGPVNIYYLMDVLSELLEKDDLIVPGSSGACAEVTQQALRIKEGQRMLNTPGLGAMGFDLPAAIGACVASGGRRTISIAGDGGFQMNIQELETLRRLQLPLKVFVLNNNGYGSICQMQKNRFAGNLVACDPTSGLTLPDICKVAKSYNLQTVRITDQTALHSEVADVLSMQGPVICELVMDPDVATAPRLSSEVLPDGRIVSKPMEDLAPFLSREEFARNMKSSRSFD